ncbi:glutamyl-trnagln amidotransferase subunit a [Trichoderma arundinaceum]|uniref:Glutamyl-trnagln amidotransferase subunit a n=1 Tax=Trichoderma arundinaceum TaxID=490622 RepID=A0A395NFP7_TRIAR|nr:glutamyl-trnagln amidotransferase subunit a [Trichoderma arundinaceum]
MPREAAAPPTVVQLAKAYLARIKEVNWTLKPVTEINLDALEIAFELDRQRQRIKSSSPEASKLGLLHGIPVLVPISMGTDDNMSTTAGSCALLGARVPEDSTVVAKLRQAVTILLLKQTCLSGRPIVIEASQTGGPRLEAQPSAPMYRPRLQKPLLAALWQLAQIVQQG